MHDTYANKRPYSELLFEKNVERSTVMKAQNQINKIFTRYAHHMDQNFI